MIMLTISMKMIFIWLLGITKHICPNWSIIYRIINIYLAMFAPAPSTGNFH
jgi:hypothetical protein